MNPLDIFAKGLIQMLGLDPKQMRQQQAAESRRKANKQPINVQGQTRTTNSKGQTRNFTSPSQSANRRPSLDPVQTRSTQQATPPRRPAGGFGQSPGQLSISQVTGGSNPNARPSGRYTAPRVGIPIQPRPGPIIPVASRRFEKEAMDRRVNQFRAGAPQQPPKLKIKGGNPFKIGNILNTVFNPLSRFNIITGLATNLTGDTNPEILKREPTEKELKRADEFYRKHKLGKYAPDYVAPVPYSGMEDASGDPVLPTRPKNQNNNNNNSNRNRQLNRRTTPQPIPVDNFDYDPNTYDLNGQSQTISAGAPTPANYAGMSELERLKIWATTHRQMIESVGTKRQRNILNQALGAAKPDPKADSLSR